MLSVIGYAQPCKAQSYTWYDNITSTFPNSYFYAGTGGGGTWTGNSGSASGTTGNSISCNPSGTVTITLYYTGSTPPSTVNLNVNSQALEEYTCSSWNTPSSQPNPIASWTATANDGFSDAGVPGYIFGQDASSANGYQCMSNGIHLVNVTITAATGTITVNGASVNYTAIGTLNYSVSGTGSLTVPSNVSSATISPNFIVDVYF